MKTWLTKIKWFWRNLFSWKLPLFKEIQVPTFQIVNNPMIRLSEIKARRFYIIDRNLITNRVNGRPSIFHSLPYMRSRTEIMEEEDKKVLSAINTAKYFSGNKKPDMYNDFKYSSVVE